jgi:uncharacterized protein involved in exopolysaccharide biosynthesis
MTTSQKDIKSSFGSDAEPNVADYSTRDADEVSFVRLGIIGLRHWRVMAGVPLVAMILVLTVALLRPRQYSSTILFMPEMSTVATKSELAGIAAQFGIGPSAGDLGQSPAFYRDLVLSDGVLRKVVSVKYKTNQSDSVPLLDILDIDDESTPAQRLELGVRRLRDKHLSVSINDATGVIEARATTRWAEVSMQVLVHLIGRVNEFNLGRIRASADARRQFAEERLNAAKEELKMAEDQLQAFLQRNRVYSTDPQLRFQQDRLQREVDTRHQVVNTLAQSYEQARIDVARDTPVVTVVEAPRVATVADRRGLVAKLLIAGLLGLIAAFLVALWQEWVRSLRESRSQEYWEFSEAFLKAKAQLMRWRTRLPPSGAAP